MPWIELGRIQKTIGKRRKGIVMLEAEHLSTVVGDIYDAAIDPDLWPSVLEQVCAFVGGYAASLFIHDAALKKVEFVSHWGGDPQWWEVYKTTYAKINPAFPLLLLRETGSVLANIDIIPESELSKTRFFKEWLQPQGFVDTVGAVLEKSLTGCAAFAILRNAQQGIVDATTRRRIGPPRSAPPARSFDRENTRIAWRVKT